MTYYLGIDPGVDTGIVLIRNGDLKVATECSSWWFVTSILKSLEPDEVVCEDFIISPATLKKGIYYESLWAIGTIKQHCLLNEIPLVMQRPEERLVVSDAGLKKIGWWTPGKGHANDAARHVAKRMITREQMRMEEIYVD